MIVEIINTGTELMLGRVLNTNQQWLCGRLTDLGYMVSRQVAVADAAEAVAEAVRESLSRADLVITTGGLGPTSDDLTRDAIARLLNRDLKEDPAVLAAIMQYFARRNRPAPERTRAQALVPEGARVLPNANGTAPGLAIQLTDGQFRPPGKPSWLMMLPGPPRELRPMFDDTVVSLLRQELPTSRAFVCRTLGTVDLGESLVEERISGPLRPLIERGLQLGYCARPGEVDVRLGAWGAEAEALVKEAEALVRSQLGEFLIGVGDMTLEEFIIRELTARTRTLAVAESCTGGLIAHRLTNVPGASAVLLAGLVTYSNIAKQACLGVRAETLASHGAVSAPVAREMAEGARRTTGADFAVSVTGIAGPSGGTAEKPVGTVFMAVASSDGTLVRERHNPGDRATFKEITARQVLNELRLVLRCRKAT